jgi:purine nucleoside phosphorylase
LKITKEQEKEMAGGMAEMPQMGVIGGSGLYEMPGLKETHEYDLDTPFGRPSAPVIVGELEGRRTASGTTSHRARSITVPTSTP